MFSTLSCEALNMLKECPSQMKEQIEVEEANMLSPNRNSAEIESDSEEEYVLVIIFMFASGDDLFPAISLNPFPP